MRPRLIVAMSLVAALMAAFLTANPVSAATKQCMGHTATQTAPVNGIYLLTSGDDVIVGTSQADVVNAPSFGGSDYICTGGGNDTLSIAVGVATYFDTGSGSDTFTAYYGVGPLTVETGSGNDALSVFVNGAVVSTGSGNDHVFTSSTGLIISTDSCRDWVEDNGGAVSIDCGSNVDTYNTVGTPVITRCEKASA